MSIGKELSRGAFGVVRRGTRARVTIDQCRHSALQTGQGHRASTNVLADQVFKHRCAPARRASWRTARRTSRSRPSRSGPTRGVCALLAFCVEIRILHGASVWERRALNTPNWRSPAPPGRRGSAARRGSSPTSRPRSAWGSVASPLCTAAQPLHTRFANKSDWNM